MSAIRPSMMELVSRIFRLRRALTFAREEVAEGGEIEQIALAGTNHNPTYDIRKEHEDLYRAERSAGRQAVAQDHAEKECSEDAEDAADYGADQPLEADSADTQFKHDNERSGGSACSGGSPMG